MSGSAGEGLVMLWLKEGRVSPSPVLSETHIFQGFQYSRNMSWPSFRVFIGIFPNDKSNTSMRRPGDFVGCLALANWALAADFRIRWSTRQWR